MINKNKYFHSVNLSFLQNQTQDLNNSYNIESRAQEQLKVSG